MILTWIVLEKSTRKQSLIFRKFTGQFLIFLSEMSLDHIIFAPGRILTIPIAKGQCEPMNESLGQGAKKKRCMLSIRLQFT